MATWADDFDRADGALGSSWYFTLGVTSISGHAVIPNGNWRCQTNQIFMPGDGFVEATFRVGSSYTTQGVVAIKANVAGTNCYFAFPTLGATGGTVALYRQVAGSNTVIASGSVSYPSTPSAAVRIEYVGGVVRAYAQGVVVCAVADATHPALDQVGLAGYGAGFAITRFEAVTVTAASFVVSPALLGTEDQGAALTLTGGGSLWTPGSPGEPTFTVNLGAILAQSVLTQSSATVVYNPPTSPGSVVFTDPASGLTATVLIVAGKVLGVSPGGDLLTVGGAEVVNNAYTGEAPHLWASHNYIGATPIDITITELYQFLAQFLIDQGYRFGVGAASDALVVKLWQIINGAVDPVDGDTVLGNAFVAADRADTILDRMSFAKTDGAYDVGTLMREIAGYPGGNIQDVLTALSSVSAPDLSSILAAIAAVRGDGSPDLRTLADMAENLRTTHGYDLASVKSWIDALPHAQAGPSALLIVATVAALALAIPSGGASIAAEAVAIGAGPLLDLTTLVEVASVLGELAGIASSIASLRDSLTTPTVVAAPVWPGDGLVTLGASHALADGLVVAGPMHGAIVTITSHPSGAGSYSFGSVKSWQHCGALLWRDDAGHYERAESFGLDSQILTPRTMARAESALVRLNSGWTGTIRGWTVTA